MKEYPIEDFFRFEKENDLFDLVDKHGANVWDLVRFDVYENLTAPGSVNRSRASKNSIKRVFRLLLIVLKWFFSIFRRFDFLFFLSSRNQQDGKPIDINLIDTLKYVWEKKKKTIAIETFARLDDLEYDFDVVLPLFPMSIIKIFLRNKYDFDFSDLLKKVQSKYPECTLSESHYEGIYLRFYTEKLFYKYFIKKWGCKKIFITQNGVFKGLFAACKDLGVDAIEYQHGAIVKAHPIYSYPQLDNPFIGLSLPTFLCVYSEQWLTGVYLPYTKVVEMGNDMLYTEPSSTIDEHNILVISAHGGLGKLILDFIIDSVKTGNLNGYNIFFKLHPYQSDDYESYKSKVAGYSNIRIIRNGNSLDYIKQSKHIIAVSSTCIYEALQHNTNIYILKLPTYTQMENVFHSKNVFIVDRPDELVNIITEADPNSINECVPFYKQFNCEILKSIIRL